VTAIRIRVHAPGPPGHGGVRHARLVAGLAAAHGVRAVTTAADLTHAQFTDALYGPDIAASAAEFTAWALDAPRPLVVTLHDVPGADPDPARDARRVAGYARVVAACDAVVVSAEHEAAKVARFTGRTATVVDLPVPRPVPGGARPAWADGPTLGVLGFVHPGKGHRDVIEAAARHGLRVVAAGALAPGHDEVMRALAERAERHGVELVVTGSLGDADLAAAARAVTVPVAPSAVVSASGTLMTWRGCGRRPLAADGEYAAEIDRRHPGTLHLYADAAALPAAVEAVLADLGRTRLGPDPGIPDAGAEHAALYRRVLNSRVMDRRVSAC
jgi:glycosyltransferase involved in cell wall biosynthesis